MSENMQQAHMDFDAASEGASNRQNFVIRIASIVVMMASFMAGCLCLGYAEKSDCMLQVIGAGLICLSLTVLFVNMLAISEFRPAYATGARLYVALIVCYVGGTVAIYSLNHAQYDARDRARDLTGMLLYIRAGDAMQQFDHTASDWRAMAPAERKRWIDAAGE